MARGTWSKMAVVLVILGLGLVLVAGQAQAVPSFGRQTGLECSACHTVFPELTPVGRNFKLNGYTSSKKSDKPYEFPPPISGHMILSFTNLKTPMPRNVASGIDPQGEVKANDN